jgi:hypothetical protein
VLRTFASVAILSLVAASVVGATKPKPRRIQTGTWGGQHLRLQLHGDKAILEFDCAGGEIDGPLTVDRNGRFSLAGTITKERGGPVRRDDVPDTHPARFSGKVTGKIMHLTIKLTDSGEAFGTYDLRFGSEGRVMRCL